MKKILLKLALVSSTVVALVCVINSLKFRSDEYTGDKQRDLGI